MRDELAQGEEAKSVHESEIAQQEFELSDYRVRIEGLDSEASQIRDTVQNLRNRVFSAENRISTNAERIEEARGMIDRHQADIALADEKLRHQQQQIEGNRSSAHSDDRHDAWARGTPQRAERTRRRHARGTHVRRARGAAAFVRDRSLRSQASERSARK